ncbi:MAG: CDGSH iron-sulfur domain-containing protein [Candidatus Eremiobacteraeota bacterium]|nr:CDGSH iron-sulfur domain-containing protein [Candidatus Eremiobacteraeota bacterium]MBC5802708.1 CDGSH iron-sulfur domain-containing protein [Candidatus Eremiobacteraeota bacterium]MBC5823019.1 CDGSH iron-sulfur domain-containing protein [Candidatus Eremiobacteraeota bacterium]
MHAAQRVIVGSRLQHDNGAVVAPTHRRGDKARGPYRVTGGVALQEASWAQGASQEHYTLCRCGGSKNKPFCDGTHWTNDFHDEKN